MTHYRAGEGREGREEEERRSERRRMERGGRGKVSVGLCVVFEICICINGFYE